MILTTNERRIQCRRRRLERRWQRQRQKLKRCPAVSSRRERIYWRAMARALKHQWRRSRGALPPVTRKRALTWWKERLRRRDYIALLRFYLLLLPLTLPCCRDECDRILRP